MSWGLFEVTGIEIEYMIVDADTLAVRPIADELLRDLAGAYVSETEWGGIGWSNELAAHVLEFKTPAPVRDLASLVRPLEASVAEAGRLLADRGALLMPGAMHPTMDPKKETVLWSRGDTSVYRAFDRIFGCSNHGFANLQSVHINLPFRGDEEFAVLHAAVRTVLPLIPCLCAASPFMEGCVTGLEDTRLETYRINQKKIPSITGTVIPEEVESRDAYRSRILEPIWADMAPYDPEGLLRKEWLNSRGAIARFDRSALEIRLVDAQECPRADLAAAALIVATVKGLVAGRLGAKPRPGNLSVPDGLGGWSQGTLALLLDSAIRGGGRAVIDDRRYLDLFGYPGDRCTGLELWRHIHAVLVPGDPDLACFASEYAVFFSEGTLAERLLLAAARAAGGHGFPGVPEEASRAGRSVDGPALCRSLAGCLAGDRMLRVPAPPPRS